MSEDRIITGKGLINDVKMNLLSICMRAFRTEELSLITETPLISQGVNPDYVNIQDIPAIFAWVDGFQPTSDSIGQSHTIRQNEKLTFHARVQYIRTYISSEEDANELDHVGWLLFEYIDQHKNLNDLVRTETIIPEITTLPMIRNVQGKLQPVSNVNMKLVFTVLRKKQMATRRPHSKYR